MVDFAKQMKKWATKTEKDIATVTVDIITELARTVTFRTPIGDPTLWQSMPPAGYIPGTLINNWFSSIDVPNNGPLRAPNSFAVDTFADIEKTARMAPGHVFYFQNPVRYAWRIEFGWSSQAPKGMVRLSVRNFDTIAKRAMRKHL